MGSRSTGRAGQGWALIIKDWPLERTGTLGVWWGRTVKAWSVCFSFRPRRVNSAVTGLRYSWGTFLRVT